MKILEKVFSIYSGYSGYKKYKIITFLGFKIKINITTRKFLKQFILENRPQMLPNSVDENSREKVYLAIVAIFKNEPDIIEWIEYHRLAGVERFYLYDNGSTDNSKDKLQPYIDDGTVVYRYAPGKCMQYRVYRDAIYKYKNEAEWLAIIDLDEYICPVKVNDIKEVLKDYEKYPALAVNWIMFDSNGLEKRPNMPVIEAYTRVRKNYDIKHNHSVKSIVNPREVRLVTSPHYCFYKGKKLAVCEDYSELGNPVSFYNMDNAITNKTHYEKIRINHYHSKSKEDYLKKISGGFADLAQKRCYIEHHINFEDTTHDYVIQKYLPELKKKLEEKQ